MPSDASLFASSTKEATVCCETPGSDAIGTGASIDSRTNRGATRSSTAKEDSATRRRMAGSRRSRRILRAGKPISPSLPPAVRCALVRRPLGERLHEPVDGVHRRHDVDAEARLHRRHAP